MGRLRPRERPAFSGFTKAEIEKMEKLLKESGEQLLNREICQRIAKSFNRSSGRAGKPIVKWNEVHSWFQNQQQNEPAASKNVPVLPKASPSNGTDENLEMPKEDSSKAGERIPDSLEAGERIPDSLEAGERIPDLLELEFEAKSSKDGAWYDVDVFLAHRFLSGEIFVSDLLDLVLRKMSGSM